MTSTVGQSNSRKDIIPSTTGKLPDYRIDIEFPFEKVRLDYAVLFMQGLFIIQINKHMNPIFLFFLVQQQIILILNWYQHNCPRVCY